MSAIEFVQVNRSYPNGVTAIENLSLQTKKGEFVVVLGGIGSGKTVLLHMIAGLEPLTSGQILYDGHALPQDISLRNTAMMLQSYGLRPDLTVRQNLALGLKLRGIESLEIDQRIQSAASRLEFGDVLQKKPRKLPLFLQKKIQLARVLVRKPCVFLLDDPCAGLAEPETDALCDLIARVHAQENIPFFYATRNWREAARLDCRTIVLNRGRLMGFDRYDTLYRQPDNPFLAAFLGELAMNLVASDLVPSWTGDRGLVGFRPQEVRLTHKEADPQPDCVTLAATVFAVEEYGNQKLYHLKIDGKAAPVLALDSGSKREIGSAVTLLVHKEHIKLFQEWAPHGI